MKLKCTTIAAVCLFTYFLFAAAVPYSVEGKSEKTNVDEVYEIDYRGPETHNSRPPPANFHGKSPYTHHTSSAVTASGSAGSAGFPSGGNS